MTRARALEAPPITPQALYEQLDRYVIGQERAKRVVAIAAYNHLKRTGGDNPRPATLLKKSNILLIGPTGCGKTHLARQLARILQVPFTVVNATEYTEAGYYGKDVEVMLGELLLKSGGIVEKAERGIIFLDEVDKISRREQGARTGAGTRDIGGEGVQHALLKLLEGTEVYVPLNVTQHWNKHDFVLMNTANILFICAGTFSDMPKLKSRGEGSARRTVGFTGTGEGGGERIGPEDLINYGLVAEFVGRLPVVVELGELSPDDLRRVLTEPPDAVIKEYRELMATDDISLRFTRGALDEVVRAARRQRSGARGLRSVVEELMHDLMFEAPARRGERIVVDKRYAAERLEHM